MSANNNESQDLFDMLGADNENSNGVSGLSGSSVDAGDNRGRSNSDGVPVGDGSATVDDSLGVLPDGVGGQVSTGVDSAGAATGTGLGASAEDSSDASVAGSAGGHDDLSDSGLVSGGTGTDAPVVGEPGSSLGLDQPGTHQSGGVNFVPGTQIHVPNGPKSRARANIEAIRVIRTLENEGWRAATTEEQQTLAGYSSWGAVPQIFEGREDWADLQTELRELLSDEEYKAAAQTTMNAHYTDPAIAKAMWDALQTAGFENGIVLEPGCGSGNFIGQAPSGASMVGIELDPLSAKIASALYPEATIRSEGYERTRIPTQNISAAIGNVPFGDYRIPDRVDNREDLSIHNYFMHKTMKNMPEGAYGVFLTSSWTLDGKKAKAREVIAEHSDLVGAVRLPSTAFSRVAGTEAQADILIFRRRAEGQMPSKEQLDDWVRPFTEVHEIDGEKHEIATSRYFAKHPENILGDVTAEINQFGRGALKVTAESSGQDLAAQVRLLLNNAVTAHQDDLGFAPKIEDAENEIFAPGGFVVPNPADTSGAFTGTLRTVDNAVALEVLDMDGQWQEVDMPRNKATAREQYALVQLKESIRAVVDSNGGEAELADLNTKYDAYVEKYGYINRFTVRAGRVPSEKQIESRVAKELTKWQNSHGEVPKSERQFLIPDEEMVEQWREEASAPSPDVKIQNHLNFLRRDPDFGKLLALEVFDEAEQTAKKSGYFEADTFSKDLSERIAETPQEALAISLEETRGVSLARVGELLGLDEEGARRALGELVFDDPMSDELIPAVKYLSGDVRQKLRDAQIAAFEDSRYQVNIDRLNEVLPEWAALSTVAVQPGVRFVTAEEYEQFISDVFGAEANVTYTGGQWRIDGISGKTLSAQVQYEYGTSRRDPVELLRKKMNNSPVTVNDTEENEDGKPRSVPNLGETSLARAKQDALVARFVAWVHEDPERAERIERRYNDQVNSYVAPDYTSLGEHLRLTGLNDSITPHPYQREAVARVVNEPSVLLDHVVGAGKTGTMIMSAMELRRTGVAEKPWIVVPNHLVDQVTREFAQWYPSSNVLPIPTGLSAEERRYYGALSAAGDWDAVIAPQSVFSQIAVSPRRQRAWLDEEIDALNEDLNSTDDNVRVKQIQRSIKRLEDRYEKLQSGKTTGLTFEETGCDYLFVDEAHHYKNLRRNSEYGELSCAGSNKAMDMDFILRCLRETKTERAVAEGRGNGYVPSVATFATGTPVANTLAEMWVMGHYLRPDLMESYGIDTIDGFASVFTKAENNIEVKPSGVGFRVKNSIALFTNMDQLMALSSAYTSSVTREQIPQKLPEVKDGGMRAITREASPEVREYVDDLVKRIENPGEDEYVIQLLGYARKVALDPRMMGLDRDEDGGRPALVADEIMRIHSNTKDRQYTDTLGEVSSTTGGLQIVFCDQGTPGGAGFDMYRAISDELVERGMEPEKIEFIHNARTDSERASLFARCRNGEVSVLIGSTEKMGTGMNVQSRALAIHHVDMPWRPADLDQREGRAIRQGNQNDEIEILSYVTQHTFDAYMMQKLVTKSKALSQLKNHAVGNVMEDIGEVTMKYQEIMAVASGDERVGEWIELTNKVHMLQSLKMAHESSTKAVRFQLSTAEARLAGAESSAEKLEAFKTLAPGKGDLFYAGGRGFETRNDEAGNAMLDQLRKAYIRSSKSQESILVGRAGNLLYVARSERGSGKLYLGLAHAGTGENIPGIGIQLKSEDLLGTSLSPRGVAMRMWNMTQGLDTAAERQQVQAKKLSSEITELREVVAHAGVFDRQEELDELKIRQDFLRQALELDVPDELDQVTQPELEDDGYLKQEDMDKLFVRYPSDVSALRPGDIVRINDGGSTANKGFAEVVRDRLEPDANEQTLFKDPKSGKLKQFTYYQKWEFVKRQRDALTPFERSLMNRSEADYVLKDTDFIRFWEYAKDGVRVRVLDQERDDKGQPIWSKSGEQLVMREGVITGQDRSSWLLNVRTDEGKTYEVKLQNRGGISPIVLLGVVDVEEQRRLDAEEQARIEKDHATFYMSRLFPGDVLAEDVDKVGQRGDVYVENRFADPITGIPRDNLRWQGFQGEVIPGREMTDKEIQQLFGDSLQEVTIEDLRAGDVVDGKLLNPKETRNGYVRIVDPGGAYSSFSDVKYRHVTDNVWEPVSEVRRKSTTAIGSVISRRYGALNRHEMMKLQDDVMQISHMELDESQIGKWINIPTGENTFDYNSNYLGETVSGVLKSVNVRHPFGEPNYQSRSEFILDVDGEERKIAVDWRRPVSVILMPQGYPEGGFDFRGVSLVEALAESEATAGLDDALKKLAETGPRVPMGMIEVSSERDFEEIAEEKPEPRLNPDVTTQTLQELREQYGVRSESVVSEQPVGPDLFTSATVSDETVDSDAPVAETLVEGEPAVVETAEQVQEEVTDTVEVPEVSADSDAPVVEVDATVEEVQEEVAEVPVTDSVVADELTPMQQILEANFPETAEPVLSSNGRYTSAEAAAGGQYVLIGTKDPEHPVVVGRLLYQHHRMDGTDKPGEILVAGPASRVYYFTDEDIEQIAFVPATDFEYRLATQGLVVPHMDRTMRSSFSVDDIGDGYPHYVEGENVPVTELSHGDLLLKGGYGKGEFGAFWHSQWHQFFLENGAPGNPDGVTPESEYVVVLRDYVVNGIFDRNRYSMSAADQQKFAEYCLDRDITVPGFNVSEFEPVMDEANSNMPSFDIPTFVPDSWAEAEVSGPSAEQPTAENTVDSVAETEAPVVEEEVQEEVPTTVDVETLTEVPENIQDATEKPAEVDESEVEESVSDDSAVIEAIEEPDAPEATEETADTPDTDESATVAETTVDEFMRENKYNSADLMTADETGQYTEFTQILPGIENHVVIATNNPDYPYLAGQPLYQAEGTADVPGDVFLMVDGEVIYVPGDEIVGAIKLRDEVMEDGGIRYPKGNIWRIDDEFESVLSENYPRIYSTVTVPTDADYARGDVLAADKALFGYYGAQWDPKERRFIGAGHTMPTQYHWADRVPLLTQKLIGEIQSGEARTIYDPPGLSPRVEAFLKRNSMETTVATLDTHGRYEVTADTHVAVFLQDDENQMLTGKLVHQEQQDNGNPGDVFLLTEDMRILHIVGEDIDSVLPLEQREEEYLRVLTNGHWFRTKFYDRELASTYPRTFFQDTVATANMQDGDVLLRSIPSVGKIGDVWDSSRNRFVGENGEFTLITQPLETIPVLKRESIDGIVSGRLFSEMVDMTDEVDTTVETTTAETEEEVTEPTLKDRLLEQDISFTTWKYGSITMSPLTQGHIVIAPNPTEGEEPATFVGRLTDGSMFRDRGRIGFRMSLIVDGAENEFRYVLPQKDDATYLEFYTLTNELPEDGIDIDGLGKKTYVVDLAEDATPIEQPVTELEADARPEPGIDIEAETGGLLSTESLEKEKAEYELSDSGELGLSAVLTNAVMEKLTEDEATVEDSKVVPANEQRTTNEQATSVARTSLASVGVQGKVNRVTTENLALGDMVFIEHMDDGLIVMPDSMFDLKSTKVEDPLMAQKFNVPMALYFLREAEDGGVVLRGTVNEREVEVTAQPTAEDGTFEVLNQTRASVYSRVFTHQRADNENLLKWATMQPREIQVGDTLSIPNAKLHDVFGEELPSADVDNVLVLAAEATRSGVELKVQDGEYVKNVHLGYRDRVHVDELSTNESFIRSRELLYEAEALTEIDEPVVGQEVLATGTDYQTGDSIEMKATVADVVDDEGVASVVLRDDAGQEHTLVPGTESLRGQSKPAAPEKTETTVDESAPEQKPEQAWNGKPYINAKKEPLTVEAGQSMVAMTMAQVRPGDMVQVGDAPALPVYQVAQLNDTHLNVSVLHPEHGLVTADFAPDTRVKVETYPASDKLSPNVLSRQLQRVRPGDVVMRGREVITVTGMERDVNGSMRLRGETVNGSVAYTADPYQVVPMRYPMCEEERAGIRGATSMIPVMNLRVGDQLKTKNGNVVISKLDKMESGKVRIGFQAYGETGSSSISFLEKDSEYRVMVYDQFQRPGEKPEQKSPSAPTVTTAETEVAVAPEIHSNDAGPSMN